MLTSIRGLVAASILATSGLAAVPAFAQGESDISVSGNAALVTQYRFRGVGLSGGDIAIQGGIDVAHSSGFYIGTWGSSLANSDTTVLLDDGTGSIDPYDVAGYGAMELDIYGGWSGEIGSGVSADVGVLWYAYPNATKRNAIAIAPLVVTDYPTFDGYEKVKHNYIEFYGSVGYSFGPAEATLGIAYAPKQDSLDFGGKRDNFYVYTDVGVGIPNTPVSVTGHLGYTSGALTFKDNEKALDWSIGADLAIGEHLSVGVAYIGVQKDGGKIKDVTDDAVVGTLSVSF